MKLVFSHRKITGLLAIVPANERSFVDEMANFNSPPARSLKLKQVMGYDKHRLVDGPVCASDLVCFGMEHLFSSGKLGRDDCDALIVVTQSPDYLMPPTSSVIQGRLGLKQDMFCLDINQGCAGFLIGLFQAFFLLEQPAVRRVALVNVDVMSRKTSPRDRNSYPLIGDAASIAIVERSDDPAPIHANLKMDGTRHEALMIPAGGLRLPCSPETAVMVDDGENNFRAKDNLRMDGSAVFNFVQVEVPPNRFMLQKLADQMSIPYEKMPSNIVENYGNSSGVTVPMAIVHNLHERLLTSSIRACLAGFGVGLTWSSMLMRLGPLDFCELVDYK
jgi:3-oxoacyl-[acyl-carrier-protein] synthase-3